MKKVIVAALALLMLSCKKSENTFDASGVFEADEVIVSSELGGRILSLAVHEGDTLPKGKVVGAVDAVNVTLQKEQVKASIAALKQKTNNVQPQVLLLQQQLVVQRSQLDNLQKESRRFENLVKADAATPKQLDDILAQVDVLQKQMGVTKQQINVQRSNTSTQNMGILSESAPLQKRVAQLNDQLQRSGISNPVNGTVLTKYAEAGEITAPGKALYKIADLTSVYLRAYISGNQLSQVKLNQQVKVAVDSGANSYRYYTGRITWISDQAEFTPKTIQTKEERANLVYAVKIKVPNDGFLRIGMYGEINLQQ